MNEILTRKQLMHLEKQYLSLEELLHFYQVARTDLECKTITVLLQNGLQPGEICRGEFGDFDFEKQRLTVDSRMRNKQIPLAPFCCKYVVDYQKANGRTVGPLFLTKSGALITVRYINRMLERISEAAHIRRVTTNVLQKSYELNRYSALGIPPMDFAAIKVFFPHLNRRWKMELYLDAHAEVT